MPSNHICHLSWLSLSTQKLRILILDGLPGPSLHCSAGIAFKSHQHFVQAGIHCNCTDPLACSSGSTAIEQFQRSLCEKAPDFAAPLEQAFREQLSISAASLNSLRLEDIFSAIIRTLYPSQPLEWFQRFGFSFGDPDEAANATSILGSEPMESAAALQLAAAEIEASLPEFQNTLGLTAELVKPRCQEACPMCRMMCFLPEGHDGAHDSCHQVLGMAGVREQGSNVLADKTCAESVDKGGYFNVDTSQWRGWLGWHKWENFAKTYDGEQRSSWWSWRTFTGWHLFFDGREGKPHWELPSDGSAVRTLLFKKHHAAIEHSMWQEVGETLSGLPAWRPALDLASKQSRELMMVRKELDEWLLSHGYALLACLTTHLSTLHTPRVACTISPDTTAAINGTNSEAAQSDLTVGGAAMQLIGSCHDLGCCMCFWTVQR